MPVSETCANASARCVHLQCACLVMSLGALGCANGADEPLSGRGVDRDLAELKHAFAWPVCNPEGTVTEDGSYAALSDTGLYCDTARGVLNHRVKFYRPAFELWADGAKKRRHLWLPPGEKIDSSDMDNWVFPIGTRVWKEFRDGGKKLETRLLEKREDGTWYSMAFVWNAAGTDAYPAPEGESDVRGTAHDAPSQGDCAFCHRNASDTLLGVSALQLAGGSSPAGVTLAGLSWTGRLSDPPTKGVRFPGTRQDRNALGYLFANCAGCHRGERPFAGLDLSTSVDDTRLADTAVYRTAFGQPLARWTDHGFDLRIAPGSAADSAVVARMASRLPGEAMPPLGSEVVDEQALAQISAWIDSLD